VLQRPDRVVAHARQKADLVIDEDERRVLRREGFVEGGLTAHRGLLSLLGWLGCWACRLLLSVTYRSHYVGAMGSVKRGYATFRQRTRMTKRPSTRRKGRPPLERATSLAAIM